MASSHWRKSRHTWPAPSCPQAQRPPCTEAASCQAAVFLPSVPCHHTSALQHPHPPTLGSTCSVCDGGASGSSERSLEKPYGRGRRSRWGPSNHPAEPVAPWEPSKTLSPPPSSHSSSAEASSQHLKGQWAEPRPLHVLVLLVNMEIRWLSSHSSTTEWKEKEKSRS